MKLNNKSLIELDLISSDIKLELEKKKEHLSSANELIKIMLH